MNGAWLTEGRGVEIEELAFELAGEANGGQHFLSYTLLLAFQGNSLPLSKKKEGDTKNVLMIAKSDQRAPPTSTLALGEIAL